MRAQAVWLMASGYISLATNWPVASLRKMVSPSQSSLKGAWSVLISSEPSQTTLKPLAGMLPMLEGSFHSVRFSASLLRYMPPRSTASSLGL